MSYIKAKDILPEELIRRIQEYVDGVYIYIPRKPGTRHTWGQETNYKAELGTRNNCIRSAYAAGNITCPKRVSAGFCKNQKPRAGNDPGSYVLTGNRTML